MVERVEEFGSELQAEPLGYGGVLQQGQIDVCQAWAAQSASA